jgi:hypothetical protein
VIALGQLERLADPQRCAPQHDDQPAQAQTMHAIASVTHHHDDLLDRLRIGRLAHALVARRPASRHRLSTRGRRDSAVGSRRRAPGPAGRGFLALEFAAAKNLA